MLDKKKINFRRKRMTTPDKRYRYSIRKFNVGIASVAIAAFMFLGNGAVSVSANDLASNEEAIPTSGPVSEEDLSSSTEIKETEPVSSSTLPTETPEETPAQTEKVVTEETVPVAENADSLPTNESQQESLGTKESDDALAAAKKVLEQVISEAEVLSADALRKAAKSTADTSSLQSAANATKAAAEAANQVFADEHASLEDINAQITAIRTAVVNLGPELTSFTGTEEVTVMLAATTSGVADANQSGIDEISERTGQYTAISVTTQNFKWTDIEENPIIALKMLDGTYKYKKFSDQVTVDKAKAAKDEFVDAAAYKAANGPLQAGDKVYIIQESDFTSAPTSIEESYDLTKFHHREHLIFGGDNVWDGVTADDLADPDADADNSAFIALARPGSFESEIEFKDASHPEEPSIYLPKENNTVLVADSISEALSQSEPSYKNFGLFLSHIAVNDDKVNKPNTVMELPQGVEVVFADRSGQQTTFAGAMDEIMAALRYDENDGTPLNPQQKLKFKFIVKKDGVQIQADENWREITLHVYSSSDAVKELVKTTLTNTKNDFEAGIVDNIDFSGLPEEMKNEAIEMEKTYRNVDGSLPQDGQLPEFSNPDNKDYDWIDKDRQESAGNHATSPARYFPYDMDLFQGDGNRINETLRGYIPYLGAYKYARGDDDIIAIPPSEHDQKLFPYYTLGSIFTNTMFGRNMTPESGGVNGSYWHSLTQAMPIPQLDFEPEVNLDIVTLSDNPQPNPKGTVKIVYKALNADGTDVDSSVVLRADVTDTEDAAVGTPWNAKETGVDHDKDTATAPIDERPETFTTQATETNPSREYKLVSAKTTVQTPTDAAPVTVTDDAQLEGQVIEGTTTVTYYYALVQEQPATSREVKGDVIIKYEDTAGTEIKGQLKDTDQGVVATYTTPSRRYIKVDNQVTYLDSEPAETVELSNLAYNADQTREDGTVEKPATIESAGKTYRFIKLKDDSATVTGLVTEATKTVTYVYAPEQTREVPTEKTGSVIVEYKLEGSETPEKPEGTKLQADFKDTTDQLVSTSTVTETYYVDANGVEKVTNTSEPVVTNTNATYEVTKDEAPDVLTIGGKTYHKVRVNGTENGTLPAGETKVTYYYAEEQVEEGVIEEKGNVTIKYETEGGAPLKSDYKDSENVLVSSTPTTRRYYLKDGKKVYLDEQPVRGTTTKTDATYDTREDKSETGGVNEKPATLTDESGTTYHLIKTKDETPENGTLPAGDTVVTYVYAPEQTREVPTPSNGSVIVEYKLEGSETTENPEGTKLQADFKDTTDQLVSTSTVTETYYVDENGEEQVTNTSEPVVTLTNATYEVTKDEAPDVLTIGGKTYHKVRVNGTENGTLPAGETKVTYYYAEEQVEEGVIEEKGNVTVKYETESGTTLKPDYKDSENVLVSSTPTTRRYYLKDGNKVYLDEQPVRGTTTKTDATYDTREDKSETGGVNEKPATLTDESGTTYHLIKTKDKTPENGTLPAGDTVVTYVYAPEQTEIISTENKAKVTVNYYILGTSTPLQPSYEDIPATKISETVTTNTYYLDANNERVPVGDPAVVINPVDPAVSYDTTETKNGKEERPTTLKSGDKTYHLVEAATTFTEGTGVSGTLTKDTVVNYYYAEIKEEVTTVPTNGSVTIKYETVDGKELQSPFPDTPSTEISSITTKRNYYEYNGVKTYVGEAEVTPSTKDVPYNTTEDNEKPEILQKGGKTYQLVAVKAGSADENGKVTGDHVVTYVYAEIKEEVTTEPTNGSVTIKYETTDGTPLRDDKEDTTSTVISTKTTTKKYYEYNGEKVYVGDPVESTETVDLSYNTTEADKDEKPSTLEKDDKTYQLVAVKAGSADENGKVTGDHVVTYVYAEVPEEPKPEEPKPEEPKPGEPTPPTDGGTTPPTDGGVNPPTDGGVNPPTDGGTTPPIDGGTTPPTDGGTTPPTDGGTTPPTDGGTTPPTDGGTTPPTDGGTTPPTDGGTTPPTDGGTTPPTDGGTTPPTDGGTTPPTDGGTTPPTDGGTTPPTDGGTTPPTDGGTTPPTDGGTTPPTDGGTTPPTDGGVNPPTDGGTTPPTDGGTTPPTDGGVNPPTDGGTTPPTDGGTTPPTDGGTTPPTDGGVNPPTDGGTTPPTDGGVNPPTDGGTIPPTDGGTTPPTDGGTTPPTDGGTTPPTDGGTTPPTDGGTTPPTDGGTTPPTDGGTTPPTDGGTTPPTDGGTTPPTDGGVNPPTDGGTTPPTDGGTTPPTDGGTTPPTDGGTTPPTDGGTTPPTDGGTTPPTDGGTTPPTDGGTTPPTDGGTTPPTDGGTTPPTDGGTTPPTDGGTTPPTDGGTTPPTDGGTTPPTDGGTTPPIDGGTTPPTDGGVNPPTDGGVNPPTDGGTPKTPPTGTITVTPKAGTAQLPNTGEASTSPLYGVLAFATGLAGLFSLVKKKKEEDQ
ncbi:MucBP domain-containing protein [Streptococcus suis]|uniref:MucBP domain-containing protein n=1 Tax=Streptococcus suis TaxID=1307 RepID=UPI001C98A265|nr:MucBP domain-containing protein [Streptococcus suis]MBY4962420.1 MucBP domain-containing protein [Streptococcus suis]MBY4979838.1 MucBP domain-containing protein [Streptococcus suis]MBY4988412.1 MucBP domain-containing protein [Streptococcus suis]MBY4995107.1 MucBP domain-containing protein [Streptococcus suis]MBY4999408.1 MucBP domain-containing protein [Streptococcus suis]